MDGEPRTAEGAWRGKSISHRDAFDRAIDAAVLEASTWGPGTYDVQVEYGACLEVTNPGAIGEYRIKLTEI